uniref:Kelch-like family member 24a n=1 Tax=Fundulus heteroclitus TaxID=8078 RepID=A0A3Q2TNY1_FUNHE
MGLFREQTIIHTTGFRVKTVEMRPEDAFDFCSGSLHSEEILKMFDEFRQTRLFTDVTLSVQGHEFPCHRALLSAYSSYFRAMFSCNLRESREMMVRISGVGHEGVRVFINYVYTGCARITTRNVESVFETACLFQSNTLRDACAKYLEDQLDPCNCLGLQRFAETHFLSQLASRCKSYALANFIEVSAHEEFLDLGVEELKKYISSEQLYVSREESVFEAVMRWVHHNKEQRKTMLESLLQNVRLPLMHPTYFVQHVEADDIIQKSPDIYHLLHEARRYHVFGNEVRSPRTCPRRSTGFSEVIVVVGGCERLGGFNLPYNDCYDPVTEDWSSLNKLPEFTKSEYAVCALRNDIIVSGGRINSRDVWMYNSQLNHWIKVASLLKGRWRHKMCTLLGKVYALGGYDGQTRLKSVEWYDCFANRWTEVAPMTEAVSSPAVASCFGRLYVIGGETKDETCSDKVQCYNPDANQWTLQAKNPIPRRCISAVSLNNMIYVCGGFSESIYCYDPQQNNWLCAFQISDRLESCGMAAINDNIYILGGQRQGGDASDKIICFNPATGIVDTEKPRMPRPICSHGCVTIHRYSEKTKP